MDGPRSRGHGARRGYDVRTRRLRGGPEGRHGLDPRISDEMRLSDLLRKFASPSERMRRGRPALGATTQVLRGALSEKVGHMSKISWRHVSALALAAFFVVGSLINIFAPGSIY